MVEATAVATVEEAAMAEGMGAMVEDMAGITVDITVIMEEVGGTGGTFQALL